MSHKAAPISDNLPRGKPRSVWPALACAALVLAGLAAYSDSFHGPFIFDDETFIAQRNALKIWPIGPILSSQRPVVQFTLALNYRLGGMDTTGYHLFNVAVHLLAALALFGVIRRTLRLPALTDRFSENAATAAAFCAALIWTLHPLQTEAVTYIIQRMESLMALFYLLTLYCFIRAAERPPNAIAWHVAAVTACAMGMGSKEIMVSAPVIVLLCDRTFVAGSFREALLRRWGLYLTLAATWLILARPALAAFSPNAPSAGFNLAGVTWLEYVQTEFGVILRYLRLTFWPVGLCLDYGDWPIARSAADIAPGAITVGALLAATVWALVRHPKWGFAGAWFFLVLAPTSSIMPIKDFAFEHRMYLPLAAIAAGAVIAAYGLGGQFVRRMSASPDDRKLLGGVAAATAALALAGVLGWLTFERNADYRDAASIWQDTARKRPGNSRAWNNLGYTQLAANRYAEAIADYARAVALKPDYAEALSNLGCGYLAVKRYDEAITECTRAIALKPDYAAAWFNRGAAYLKTGRPEKALHDFNQVIALTPDYAEAWFNRSEAHGQTGHSQEALRDLDQAIALKPDYAEALYSRGTIYVKTGHPEEALRDLNQAIALKPGYAEAFVNRAAVYVIARRYDEALHELDQAVALKPDYAEAFVNRAAVHVLARRDDEALHDLDQAIAIKPDYAAAWFSRSTVHIKTGRPNEALHDLDRAIALKPAYAEAYVKRAMVHYTMKDCPRALSDVRAAERLGAHPPADFLRALNEAVGGSGSPLSPAP